MTIAKAELSPQINQKLKVCNQDYSKKGFYKTQAYISFIFLLSSCFTLLTVHFVLST